ncbi:MAG: hypothetical protein AMXMBFR55_16890 [Gemmatimonadota bacterium]
MNFHAMSATLDRRALALATALLVTLPAAGRAQGETDVYLASIELRDGAVRVGTPRNVTGRPGYDNQPSFTRDGGAIFYTSTREDAQADIYRYVIATGRTTRVTATAPESEYSAAEVPGGGAISVIRVERDSTQRLWRIPLRQGAGMEESVIFPALKPVGYHAWADATHIAMFVLGTPPVLVLGDLSTGRSDTLMANIGRSLHRIPGGSHISFVSKAYENASWVMELDVRTRAMRPLARLPQGVEDYAWLPDGRLIAGSGSRLLVCDIAKRATWEEVADLAGAGVGGITRLAVSPAGDRLAIVGVPTPR